MSKISEHAQIHPSVKLGKNVEIGPWTYIEEGVEIGDNTWIAPHVVIRKGTKIGKDNRIHQFVSLGDDPQHITQRGEEGRLEMGDGNIIREYVSISRGTETGGNLTSIGNKNYFMAYSHVGHDCIVKNEVMLVNHAALAGHVVVKDYAMIGAFCAVHQFVTIGEYCFVAQSCLIGKNTIPYTITAGHTAMASAYGLNLVGLRRRGFSKDVIRKLQQAYKIIFNRHIHLNEIVPQLEELLPECKEIQLMIDAIKEAKEGRGFIRKTKDEDELAEESVAA